MSTVIALKIFQEVDHALNDVVSRSSVVIESIKSLLEDTFGDDLPEYAPWEHDGRSEWDCRFRPVYHKPLSRRTVSVRLPEEMQRSLSALSGWQDTLRRILLKNVVSDFKIVIPTMPVETHLETSSTEVDNGTCAESAWDERDADKGFIPLDYLIEKYGTTPLSKFTRLGNCAIFQEFMATAINEDGDLDVVHPLYRPGVDDIIFYFLTMGFNSSELLQEKLLAMHRRYNGWNTVEEAKELIINKDMLRKRNHLFDTEEDAQEGAVEALRILLFICRYCGFDICKLGEWFGL